MSKGFDIVVGNPPYMGADQMKDNFDGWYVDLLKDLYSDVIKEGAKNDFYFFFINRGMNILTKNGHFCYIVSNRIISNLASEKVRSYLMKKEITEVVSFSEDIDIFKNANVHSAIAFVKNTESNRNGMFPLKFIDKVDNLKTAKSINLNYQLAKYFNVFIDRATDDQLKIISYMTRFPHIEQYTHIHEGVRGHYISKEEYRDLSSSNREKYVPEIRGRHIRSFRLIGFNGYFKLDKTDRKKDTNETKQLRPKIVFPELRKRLEATIDTRGYIGVGGIYFVLLDELRIDPHFFLLLLNSKLFNWVFRVVYGSSSWGSALKFRSKYIYRLPIIAVPNNFEFQYLTSYISYLRNGYPDSIFFLGILNFIMYELYFHSKFHDDGLYPEDEMYLLNAVKPHLKPIECEEWSKLDWKRQLGEITDEESERLDELTKENERIIKEVVRALEGDEEVRKWVDVIKSHEWVKKIEGDG